MYLWFYEWNLFDAVVQGEHTRGYWTPQKTLGPDFDYGKLAHPGLELQATARDDGADMQLNVVNESDHDWPDAAAIIPCFNPGAPENELVPPTEAFCDEAHDRTWFASQYGLELLTDRAIHFNAALRPAVDARSREGQFVFSQKWPTSPSDAAAGFIIRESSDRRWVAGLAWEDFLSAQGHNPWRCMHLSIRVGPLARGQARQLRGRLYLMQSSRQACYELFKREFS
jgi:hypothetical protein